MDPDCGIDHSRTTSPIFGRHSPSWFYWILTRHRSSCLIPWSRGPMRIWLSFRESRMIARPLRLADRNLYTTDGKNTTSVERRKGLEKNVLNGGTNTNNLWRNEGTVNRAACCRHPSPASFERKPPCRSFIGFLYPSCYSLSIDLQCAGALLYSFAFSFSLSFDICT